MKPATSIRFAGSTLRDRAHICAFFNSPEDAYQVLLPFVKEGLDLGEKVQHTVNLRQWQEHMRWLASAEVDVSAAHSKEQAEVLDWTDSHLRGGGFDQEWTLAFGPKIASDA